MGYNFDCRKGAPILGTAVTFATRGCQIRCIAVYTDDAASAELQASQKIIAEELGVERGRKSV